MSHPRENGAAINDVDDYVLDLSKRIGLAPNATDEQIEEAALGLLAGPSTILKGMELVLGRRVDVEKDSDIMALVFGNGKNSPDERYGILLLVKATEAQIS